MTPKPPWTRARSPISWRTSSRSCAVAGSLRTLVLHPFLMLDERWAGGVSRLFAFIAELARERRTWVVAGDAFADWLTSAGAALASWRALAS